MRPNRINVLSRQRLGLFNLNSAQLHRNRAKPFCTKRKPSPPDSTRTKSSPGTPWKPARAFLEWYSSSQNRRPYITQLCLTPLIYCIGDLSAQTISGDGFDYRRSLRSLVVGLVIAIPSREWFLFLGQHFNYRSSALSLGAKVATNQLLYTPLFNVYFFAFHGILAGEGVAGAVERVKNTVPTSVPRSFLYWPFVTALNFTYVKPQSRAVATSVFAVFWQSYLSWLNSAVGKGAEKPVCDSVSAAVDASSVENLDRRLLMFDGN